MRRKKKLHNSEKNHEIISLAYVNDNKFGICPWVAK
jgi:hypothetical protein